ADRCPGLRQAGPLVLVLDMARRAARKACLEEELRHEPKPRSERASEPNGSPFELRERADRRGDGDGFTPDMVVFDSALPGCGRLLLDGRRGNRGLELEEARAHVLEDT